MGRQTNAAVGAVGAGIASAGLGAAYLAQRFLVNMNAPPRYHQSYSQRSRIPADPYMSIYLPTVAANAIFPVRGNGQRVHARGYTRK